MKIIAPLFRLHRAFNLASHLSCLARCLRLKTKRIFAYDAPGFASTLLFFCGEVAEWLKAVVC